MTGPCQLLTGDSGIVEVSGDLEKRCVLEGSEEQRAVETLKEEMAIERKTVLTGC